MKWGRAPLNEPLYQQFVCFIYFAVNSYLKCLLVHTFYVQIALFECLLPCCVANILSASCRLTQDPGPCYAYMPSWYYDQETQQCAQFVYGGCGGNANRFATESDCQRACSHEGLFTCENWKFCFPMPCVFLHKIMCLISQHCQSLFLSLILFVKFQFHFQ